MRRQCLSSHKMKFIFKICVRLSPLVLTLYTVIYFVITLNDIPTTWPRTQTRDVTKLIQPKKNTFKIVPNFVCDDMKKELLLLIVVTSAVQNSEKRQVIRDTWGKVVYEAEDKIKLIFLVGEPANGQSEVLNEQERFGDLLQGAFFHYLYAMHFKCNMYMLDHITWNSLHHIIIRLYGSYKSYTNTQYREPWNYEVLRYTYAIRFVLVIRGENYIINMHVTYTIRHKHFFVR